MSIQVNTNVSSAMIQRSLVNANKEVTNSMVKISYGKLMNAAEDAAGMMIAEGLESQARGSEVASYNAQTGSNLLQTAEGGLSSINDNLQRIRELTVQGANGTNGESEKEAIRSEIQSLTEEIDNVSKTTSFNNINLLDGSSKDIALQTGPDSETATNTLHIGEPLDSVSSESLGIPKGDDLKEAMSNSEKTAAMLDKIDSALEKVQSRRSSIGSLQNRLEDSIIPTLDIRSENMLAAQSRIRDVDIAKEISKLTQNGILQKASVSLLAQANQSPSLAISLL